ncbi:hypothetical protein SR187_6620 [Streptococcus ruminantium]|uniref:Uncharacterized protein n=1 Tax=Streptococcus ruminantium TaxID=1917441 RepID=A0A2Z5TNV3_9STRE|nr:hypothetical protein SR187_6620 [Streptococcus ruminantium]
MYSLVENSIDISFILTSVNGFSVFILFPYVLVWREEFIYLFYPQESLSEVLAIFFPSLF